MIARTLLVVAMLLTSSAVFCVASEPAADSAVRTHTFRVDGMTCSACSMAVEHALKQVNGVQSSEVDAAGGTAVIEARSTIDSQELERTIEAAGFEAHLVEVQ